MTLASPTTPVITDAQRQHFQTFGYAVFKHVFTPAEVAGYADALERLLRRRRGGADFDGVKRQQVCPIIEDEPDVFYPLIADDRLLDLVEGLLGEDALYTGGNDGNLYVGNTRWH